VQRRKKDRWLILALVAPLGLLTVSYYLGWLGADAIGAFTRWTGRVALLLLLLSLVPTALRSLKLGRGAVRWRRVLGLSAFAYAVGHLAVYSVLDYGLDIGLLVASILRSRFIWIGALALLILVPLAVTSTSRWQRRLGKRWRRLHRFTYASALLACLHYLYRFKEIRALPVVALALLGVLLVARIPGWLRRSRAS